MNQEKRNVDMLHGSIADKILLFAIPLAATGILQQLFNAADVAVVGRFAGKTAMAAVGSNSPVIGLLVNGFVGISLGANVVIARFTGQHNEEGISRGVHTAFLFSILGGCAITLLGELIAPFILGLMSVPEDVFPYSLLYLRIYLLGMPVIFLYNFESAIFRSQGDTRTPLICLTLSGVANVLLNLFFVCGLGMSVAGVALATVLSNVISSGLLFLFLLKREDAIRLTLLKVRIHREELGEMIRIGLPAGMQSMVFSISNICVQSAVNSLGSDVMAASSAAFNIEILSFYILNAFGQACTTFVGQNYGAKNLARCRRVTRIGLLMNAIFTAGVSLGILAAGRPLLSLFNSDPVIASIGMIRLRYILSFEIFNALMESFSGAMRGYGYSLVPAVLTLIGVCGTRISWINTVFRASPTFDTLMMVYPVSWIVTLLALTIAYFIFVKKILVKVEL